MANTKRCRTATHRPAVRSRRFQHDELTAVDLFSGFGGLTEGIRRAGFTAICAANHNLYKTKVHEANNEDVEHWIADLVDPDSADYHSVRDLPAADLLCAGISCVNHSHANTQKAYLQQASLFDLHDPDYEARVTRSERDRATANCVLAYADQHHPRMIIVECTTELTSWGPAVQGKTKVGDGSTYRWWLQRFANLGYRHKVLYLNSQFFGVPQSRDRLYIVFWDKAVPSPDLEHRPMSWCGRCSEVMPAVWTWKTRVPPTGSVRYGKQYCYTCPRCTREVVPPMAPSIEALDLSNLGTRIGDRDKPLAPATMARADRCRQRFPDFPAVLMPAKATHGVEKHPWQPMSTQTSQQETALLSTGAIMVAAGHTYEHPGSDCRTRDLGQPLWTQSATNTVGLLTPPVALGGQVIAAHRHNGDGQPITRPMDTVTSTHEKAVLFAAVDNYQGIPRGVGEPMPTQVGSETLGLVSAGIVPFRKNTVPTMAAEPMPAMTAEQIPGLLTAAGTGTSLAPAMAAQWRAALATLSLDDLYFRMLGKDEVGKGCGFDVDFRGRKGTFIVWGSARDQVDGFGNAVSPAVGEWIGTRARRALHGSAAVS